MGDIMNENNRIKKVFKNIVSTTIITIAPSFLSPLHLAAYSYCKKEDEKKRQLKKSQKRIENIIKQTPTCNQNIDYNNFKQVFFELYNNIDFLSIRDLEILREFCTLSHNSLNMKDFFQEENKDKIEIYDKYHGEIEDKIDVKKDQRKASFQKRLNILSKIKKEN